MTRQPWTEVELLDVTRLSRDEFLSKYPMRSYNSWETQRRRQALQTGNAGQPEQLRPFMIPAAGDYAGPEIAFWDIECTFSTQPRLLSCAITNGWGDTALLHLLDNETVQRTIECDCGVTHKVVEVGCRGAEWLDDSVLAREIRDRLHEYQIAVGWNSKLFDAPVVNGRLYVHGERGLDLTTHLDLMYEFSGGKARMGRRSLDNISTILASPHSKTPLNVRTWDRADHGDMEAYQLILEHNLYDGLVTRDVFAHARRNIRKYIRGG